MGIFFCVAKALLHYFIALKCLLWEFVYNSSINSPNFIQKYLKVMKMSAEIQRQPDVFFYLMFVYPG